MALTIIKLGKNPRTIIDPITKKRVRRKSIKQKAGGPVTKNGIPFEPGLSKRWLELNKNPGRKKRFYKTPQGKFSKPMNFSAARDAAMKLPPRKRAAVLKQLKKHSDMQTTAMRKNPPRKPHATIIVGYTGKRGIFRRGKAVYFDGSGFVRKRNYAKQFPGDGAKAEAKRILPMLPHEIYGIKIESAW